MSHLAVIQTQSNPYHLVKEINGKYFEIEKIKTENRRKFNIDEILDKISSLGIASLTIEERLFLDNYSNEKRD